MIVTIGVVAGAAWTKVLNDLVFVRLLHRFVGDRI